MQNLFYYFAVFEKVLPPLREAFGFRLPFLGVLLPMRSRPFFLQGPLRRRRVEASFDSPAAKPPIFTKKKELTLFVFLLILNFLSLLIYLLVY
jgi:hypothetical protein